MSIESCGMPLHKHEREKPRESNWISNAMNNWEEKEELVRSDKKKIGEEEELVRISQGKRNSITIVFGLAEGLKATSPHSETQNRLKKI